MLRQIILGGQDGLVNVLGIILGVATATSNPSIVIVAALAATFAESISMGAVAYTSSRAEQDYYLKELAREKHEIETEPEVEREEVRLIYKAKGFSGKALDSIVKTICSNKVVWLKVMMAEELGLSESENLNPVREGLVVGVSALMGSFIPLIPFFLLPIHISVWVSTLVSAIVLFTAGAIKAKITIGSWLKSGLEMTVIGLVAAFSGYVVGALFSIVVH